MRAMEQAAAKRCDMELKDPRLIESEVELSAAEKAERCCCRPMLTLIMKGVSSRDERI